MKINGNTRTISFCCEHMEEAVMIGAVCLNSAAGVWIRSPKTYDVAPIRFCPFCAEEIENEPSE